MSLLIWYFVLAAKRIAAAFKPRVCGTAGTPDLPVAGPSSWFHYRNIDIQISANQQPTSNSIELFLSHFAGGAAKIFSTVESSNAQQVGANGLRLSQLRQDGSKKKNSRGFWIVVRGADWMSSIVSTSDSQLVSRHVGGRKYTQERGKYTQSKYQT